MIIEGDLKRRYRIQWRRWTHMPADTFFWWCLVLPDRGFRVQVHGQYSGHILFPFNRFWYYHYSYSSNIIIQSFVWIFSTLTISTTVATVSLCIQIYPQLIGQQNVISILVIGTYMISSTNLDHFILSWIWIFSG